MEQVWQPVCFPNVQEVWVPVSALYKLCAVAHACHHHPGAQCHVNYIMSFRPAWATLDSVSNKHKLLLGPSMLSKWASTYVKSQDKEQQLQMVCKGRPGFAGVQGPLWDLQAGICR